MPVRAKQPEALAISEVSTLKAVLAEEQAPLSTGDPRPLPAARRWKTDERLLGRYRIRGELGQGGMGVVYRCYDDVGGIDVALKALPPELSHNREEMEEVRENFRLVEGLHHPSIAAVKTLEKDLERGDYYLILELAEGVDLRRWLREKGGRVSLEHVLPVLRQVAQALDFAHSRKVIHRDVKPSNVMLAPDGTVKVLDFGLAAQIELSLSRVSGGAYRTSGTGPYMAPEQWQGQAQTGATDQYALAVMTYELLAGRAPFESQDPVALRESVIHDEPQQPEEVAGPVWSVLARGLAKGRHDRYGTCVQFVEALEEAKAESERQAPELRGPVAGDVLRKGIGIKLARLVPLLVLAFGGLALALYVLKPRPPGPPYLVASTDLANEVRLSWQAKAGVSGYELMRSATNSLDIAEPLGSFNAGVTNFQDDRADKTKLYWYWVRGTNQVGPGKWSKPAVGQRAGVPVRPYFGKSLQSCTNLVGDSVDFEPEARGTGPLLYQWRRNGISLARATNATLAFRNVQIRDEGDYDLVVSNSAGTNTSAEAKLTVNMAPVISTRLESQQTNVLAGANVAFSVTASGKPTPTCQWRRDRVNLTGETSATLRLSNVQSRDAGDYDVVVSNAAGTNKSAIAALSVNVPPTISMHPSNQTVSLWKTATFSVAAKGTEVLSYQWRTNGLPIRGATESRYTIVAARIGTFGPYDVEVRNPYGTETSAGATLTVEGPARMFVSRSSGMPFVWVESSYGKGLACYVGRHEVTEGEWRSVMGLKMMHAVPTNAPRTHVLSPEATTFCARMTEKDHADRSLPLSFHYALPTTQQWNAFAGDLKLDDGVTCRHRPPTDYLTKPEIAESRMTKPNQYGLYDIWGNVWEMTETDYCGYSFKLKIEDAPTANNIAKPLPYPDEIGFRVICVRE